MIEPDNAPGNSRALAPEVSPLRAMGAQSLSHAVKGMVRLIQIAALLCAGYFFASNMYWVGEGTVAVHCRLGRLAGKHPEDAVRMPGGPHYALPYPIDRVLHFPTTLQQTAVATAFLIENNSATPLHVAQAVNPNRFVPGLHGSLVTGDKNLVQGAWNVSYRIDARSGGLARSAAHFAAAVGSIARADSIVRILGEEAIVAVIARTSVAAFVAGEIDNEQIAALVQTKADLLGMGVRITGVAASRYAPPAVLAADFQAVTQAESEKAQTIEQAVKYRIATLGEAAGNQWEALLTILDKYESSVGAKAREAFLAGQPGGSAARILDRARTDRTQTIESARADAQRFTSLHELYARDPAMMRERMRQETINDLLKNPSARVNLSPPGARVVMPLEMK